jgi:L,D-peptidoglycan transpeptidase YkuD (ErfK/YbiS/YcfS/YnhG family)
MKISIKREQSQTGLSFAEREKFGPKVKKIFQWAMAAALICGASVFTSCTKEDNPTQKGQLLEIYDVQGSAGKARLTVDGKVLFTTDVYVGKNGLGKTGEGDGKTPLGTLRPLSAFGIKPNPGTTMPYIDVKPSTYACDEDCEYYNKIIDTAETHHQCTGEEMYSYQPQYNYGIATDFNKACVYPKGSAIFIHVKGTKTYTGGCIAFDEDRMVEILKNCDMSLVITVKE